MKKYEIAVFDVDGTLLDTREGSEAAIRYVTESNGLRPLTNQELLSFMGAPIKEFLCNIYDLKEDVLNELTNQFRNRYKDVDYVKATPYDGIYDVMQQLIKKDVKLAVATYKRQDYALKILKHFGFDKYSNVLYGSDFDNKLKKVDIIEKCMIDLGVTDYSKAVMIGDTYHDALGAEQIGMDFLGVTYGYDFATQSDVEKYTNIGVAESPTDIVKYF